MADKVKCTISNKGGILKTATGESEQSEVVAMNSAVMQVANGDDFELTELEDVTLTCERL